MTTKELNVDDLLNNHDAGRPAKTNKDSKKSKYDDDWDNNEESNDFGFTTVTKTTKSKAKKKVADKGWGDDAETKPAAPVADLNKVQEQQEAAPKKGIFKKPTGETTTKPKVNVQEEYFPTLGEEPKIPPKKAEPTSPPKTETTTTTAQSSGPRRFVNAAKKGTGENFVPLDPTLTEKVAPVAPVKTEVKTEAKTEAKTEEKPVEKQPEYKDIAPKGFFSRNEKSTKELEANAAAAEAQQESKFKFGSGEGPKKFSAGGKISFKREEEKNEAEALRQQKEREIEEKLQKEREEAAKAREHKKPREHKDGEKPHHDKEDGEGKKKFVNAKKDTEKTAPRKISADKPVEEPKEEKIVGAKEVIEVHGSLSTKSWGEGGEIKKKTTTTTAAKK